MKRIIESGLTSECDREQRISLVPTHEHIQNDPRATRDDHRAEQGRPALCQQTIDLVVPSDRQRTCRRGRSESQNDQDRDERRVSSETLFGFVRERVETITGPRGQKLSKDLQ